MDTLELQGGDVLVLLSLIGDGRAEASVRALEARLGMSKSGIAQSLKRLSAVGLVAHDGGVRRLVRLRVRDFLENGARWLAPGSIGDWELGLPTSHSAEPLASKLVGDAEPLVMPLAHGPIRGRAVTPIHPRAPGAAATDPLLHRLLAIVDALRIGRARDREVAVRELAACL